ncbi:hypothetical protein AURDEDRAFT_28161, partial [Auricularia subglabra TFB-10046 SS5]
QAWQKCVDRIAQYDTELCKAYREEIDTLLVFAGVISAVVAGFAVQSYQWLQDNPNDVIIDILSQIALAVGPDGPASAMMKTRSSSSMPRSVSVRINAYWFVSLDLSLATSLIAILGKQWIR